MIPNPTLLYRLVHLDNLNIYLKRNALHAPNHTPLDGLFYKTIHSIDVQMKRANIPIFCEKQPKGVIHDYIPFYFGPLSPMLLQLKTGQVQGYTEGQEPLIYIISTVQAMISGAVNYVFSDGHGLVAYTKWYDDVSSLDKVDWSTVGARYWLDNSDDGDRKRRKQAEFLVYKQCPWNLTQGIAVLNEKIKIKVANFLLKYPSVKQPPIYVRPSWYY